MGATLRISESVADEPLAGTLVGDKYELLRELGRGGMGVVYEARNTWTHRRIALKVLHRGVPRAVQQRLFEEARTASRLAHPCIVDVLDMGATEEGALYLVQELLVGSDLEALLAARGRLSVREALAIFLPVIDALAHAHDRGVIHRDVKPSNIVLARDARGGTRPKLVDFGIARRIGDHGYTRVTLEGTLLGTPQYMAPEQILDRAPDERVDVWAIGVCLHEVLVGTVPFQSTKLHVLLREIPSFDASDPRLLVDVDVDVARAIRLALQIDPARRPTMRELGETLGRVLGAISDDDPLPLTRGPEDDGEPTVVDRFDVRELDASSSPSRDPLDAGASAVRRLPALRVGIVGNAGELDAARLRDALRAAVGRRCELAAHASYAALVDAIGDAEVDLAWLPPVAYVRAARTGAARLLVSIERSGGEAYASALLGRADSVRSLRELRGRRAVWVDGWSAAGYLVPRALLRDAGVDPDLTLASQGFVGSYDAVLESLAMGTADIGAAFCTIDASGQVTRRPWTDADGVVPIGISAPIPGDTLCASPHLAREVMESVLGALSDAQSSEPFLRLIGATALVAGVPERYRSLERALLAG